MPWFDERHSLQRLKASTRIPIAAGETEYSPFGLRTMVVEGLGFFLNNRMNYFTLEEGHANQVAPRKRTRQTINPAIALLNGKPYMAWGTPGADQQPQSMLQVFLRYVEFGMTVEHLLTMTAGFQWDEWSWSYDDPRNDLNQMRSAPDPYQFLLDKPMAAQPGEQWAYNTGCTDLLTEKPDSIVTQIIPLQYANAAEVPAGNEASAPAIKRPVKPA
jgi:hypothetical protein